MTKPPESEGCTMALEPCPFCGGKQFNTMRIQNETGLCEHSLFCCHCGGAINSMFVDDLEKRWNTRAVNQSALFERAMKWAKDVATCPIEFLDISAVINEAKAILKEHATGGSEGV